MQSLLRLRHQPAGESREDLRLPTHLHRADDRAVRPLWPTRAPAPAARAMSYQRPASQPAVAVRRPAGRTRQHHHRQPDVPSPRHHHPCSEPRGVRPRVRRAHRRQRRLRSWLAAVARRGTPRRRRGRDVHRRVGRAAVVRVGRNGLRGADSAPACPARLRRYQERLAETPSRIGSPSCVKPRSVYPSRGSLPK